MSASGGVVRARYRFIEWTLKAMPAMAVRYVATCLCCGQRSADTDNPDDVQLWCLKHAGVTGDTGYELATYSYFDAVPSGASGVRAQSTLLDWRRREERD